MTAARPAMPRRGAPRGRARGPPPAQSRGPRRATPPVPPRPLGPSSVQRRTVLAWPLVWAAAGCDNPETAARPEGRRAWADDEEAAFRFDARFFEKKRPARASDWLGQFQERGQSFFA